MSNVGILWGMKLSAYLKEHKLDDESFAAKSDGEFSAEAVRKWRFGVRMPRPRMLVLISKLTEGRVTANDFLPVAASDLYPVPRSRKRAA